MPTDLQQSRQRVSSLLRVVLLVFGGQIVLIFLVHFLFAKGVPVFQGFCDGYDFTYFHSAAQAWRNGRDPYQVNGFVTPPPSLIIPSLVAHLSEVRATRVFLCFNLVLVPLSLWWYGSALGLRWRELILLLVSATVFISTQECIRGGNMDGLMFALLIAAFCVRHRAIGPLWLAASIVIKVYSVIFLAIALRRRQWRFVGMTILAVFLFLLPFHDLWPSALHALIGRNTRYLYLSVAPARLIFSLSAEGSRTGSVVNLAFWVATFSFALYRDREVEFSPYTLARYVPWMLALPTLVFSYVGILALTVLASLLAMARKRALRRAEYCRFIGFLLLGIHVAHTTNLMPLPFDTYHGSTLVQSAGVVLMIIGTCFSPSYEDSAETLHRTNAIVEQPQGVSSYALQAGPR